MKSLLILLFACIGLNIVTAQTKIPAYGKIDKPDLEMTDCDFDKAAVAIKLIDYGKLSYDRGTVGVSLFKTVYEYRVRIKILKDKGLSYANVEIPYYSFDRDEDIPYTDACTYNLDENGKVKVTDVSKSSIYTKKINKQYSRLIIAFPEVKVGSVIEYKYRLIRDNHLSIKDWYFQDRIPTRYSEYETTIPSRYIFNKQKFIVGNLDEKNSETDDVVNIGNDAYSFKMVKTNYIMHDLVGIKTVPYMGATKDYLQRIEFTLKSIEGADGSGQVVSSSWSDIARSLMAYEDFGLQLTKEIHELDPVITQSRGITDKNERIRFLFNKIRSSMTCTDDEGIFTDEGVIKAWEKKRGNIADINMILINVLNKAGINAAPVLLSTRDNGLVNKLYYSSRQFNAVMAYVPLDNNFLVMDATDKISSYHLTPESIVNTSGLVVQGISGNWVDVLDWNYKYKTFVALQGVIDDKGMMAGECSINSMDYAKKQRAEVYVKSADNFKQQYFIKPYPGVTVEEVTVKDVDADSLPLSQKIIFSMPLNSSGEYRYFNTNMFNDFETNPFVDDERNSDIDFGFMQEYIIYCNFTIPEGYVFDALPKNISMSLPDKTVQYTRIMNAEDNVLNVKINIDFKSSYYAADKYAEFHDFFKKLLNSLNEQVVIKKK